MEIDYCSFQFSFFFLSQQQREIGFSPLGEVLVNAPSASVLLRALSSHPFVPAVQSALTCGGRAAYWSRRRKMRRQWRAGWGLCKPSYRCDQYPWIIVMRWHVAARSGRRLDNYNLPNAARFSSGFVVFGFVFDVLARLRWCRARRYASEVKSLPSNVAAGCNTGRAITEGTMKRNSFRMIIWIRFD